MDYIVWKGNTNVVKGSSSYQSVRLKVKNMRMEFISHIKESVAKSYESNSTKGWALLFINDYNFPIRRRR